MQIQSQLNPNTVPSLQEFIEAIDAIDNGISQYPNDIKPKYRSQTNLSSRVSHLNPAWNQPYESTILDVCVFIP